MSEAVIKAVKNNALKNAVNKFISLTGFGHQLTNKPINVIDQLITGAISRLTHLPKFEFTDLRGFLRRSGGMRG